MKDSARHTEATATKTWCSKWINRHSENKIINQETGESSRLRESVHLSVQTMSCAEAGGHPVPKSVWMSLVVCHLLMLSRVWIFVTPGSIARQVPLSVGFPRQEYLNELPFPTPGHFPDWGIKPHLLYCLHWQEGSLPLYHGKLKPYGIVIQKKKMKFKNSSMRCNLTCSFWEALVWERAT